SLANDRNERSVDVRRTAAEKSNHRLRPLLRARRERPRRRAADERDELAALHYPIPPVLRTKDSTALLRCGISIWPMSLALPVRGALLYARSARMGHGESCGAMLDQRRARLAIASLARATASGLSTRANWACLPRPHPKNFCSFAQNQTSTITAISTCRPLEQLGRRAVWQIHRTDCDHIGHSAAPT